MPAPDKMKEGKIFIQFKENNRYFCFLLNHFSYILYRIHWNTQQTDIFEFDETKKKHLSLEQFNLVLHIIFVMCFRFICERDLFQKKNKNKLHTHLQKVFKTNRETMKHFTVEMYLVKQLVLAYFVHVCFFFSSKSLLSFH